MVEIITALAILVIGMVALMRLFPVGLRASKVAEDLTTASHLAQEQLETIRRAGWEVYNIYNGLDTDDADNIDWYGNYDGTNYPSWRAWVRTTSVNYLYRVDLKIYWLDIEEERSETFTTNLANYR